MITAGIGRFGPYIKHGSIYVSLKDDDVLTIGLNRAVTLFADAPSSGARELGDHPRDGKPITIRKGRWGPYVKHSRTNASMPEGIEPEDLTLEQAVALLDERVAKKSNKKDKSKNSVAKKAAKAKKKAARKKKPTPKKKTVVETSTEETPNNRLGE